MFEDEGSLIILKLWVDFVVGFCIFYIMIGCFVIVGWGIMIFVDVFVVGIFVVREVGENWGVFGLYR